MDTKQFGLSGVGPDVQLGKRGPRVIANGQVVEIKDKTAAFTNAQAADARVATGAAHGDLTTLRQLRTITDIRVFAGVDGSSLPGVTEGRVLIVTTAGGGHSLGELLYGDTTWQTVTVSQGAVMKVVNSGITGYIEDHVYIWTGAIWQDIAIESKGVLYIENTVVWNSAATVVIGTVPAGATVTSVKVRLTETFDGSTEATINVGPDGGAADLYMDETEIDLQLTAPKTFFTFVAQDALIVATDIEATFVAATGGSPSTGAVTITVEYHTA